MKEAISCLLLPILILRLHLLNKLLEAGPLYEPARFTGINLTPRTQWFIKENPQSHTRIRLNRLLLEEAYPTQIARSLGGVYPDMEILTATEEDSRELTPVCTPSRPSNR